jgi:hypothetical protein
LHEGHENPVRSGREERRSARVPLPVSAQISSVSLGYQQLPARLRDVSAAGAYFYAHMSPNMGTTIRIDFSVPVSGREMGITCEGSVVRIEPNANEGLTGIALQFARYHLANL